MELSSVTLTLLFSDIEESTELLRTLGTAEYDELPFSHRALMLDAVESYGGSEGPTRRATRSTASSERRAKP
ncbi:MAG: hypothetical protein ACRDPV_03465 [Gaiellaceae bacterium]